MAGMEGEGSSWEVRLGTEEGGPGRGTHNPLIL